MEYDARTALIVVDVQNDFADPGGSLYVPGGEAVVPFVNDEVTRAVGNGAALVYTQDWHPPSTPHFEKDGGIWPVHCVVETWGAELHPELDVRSEAIRVRKGTEGEDGYSGFAVRDPVTGDETSTGLADHLHSAGIERVVVVGLALDYCVKETALDAARHDFVTTLLADGTKPVDLSPGDGERALVHLGRAGITIM